MSSALQALSDGRDSFWKVARRYGQDTRVSWPIYGLALLVWLAALTPPTTPWLSLSRTGLQEGRWYELLAYPFANSQWLPGICGYFVVLQAGRSLERRSESPRAAEISIVAIFLVSIVAGGIVGIWRSVSPVAPPIGFLAGFCGLWGAAFSFANEAASSNPIVGWRSLRKAIERFFTESTYILPFLLGFAFWEGRLRDAGWQALIAGFVTGFFCFRPLFRLARRLADKSSCPT